MTSPTPDGTDVVDVPEAETPEPVVEEKPDSEPAF